MYMVASILYPYRCLCRTRHRGKVPAGAKRPQRARRARSGPEGPAPSVSKVSYA